MWRLAMVALVVCMWPAPALAKQVHGATILDEVTQLEDGRFRSKKDWDRTLRFFHNVYRRKKGIVWHTVVTPPNVKAFHIQNTRAKRKWDGINIYQTTKDGKTFIFVLPAKDK